MRCHTPAKGNVDLRTLLEFELGELLFEDFSDGDWRSRWLEGPHEPDSPYDICGVEVLGTGESAFTLRGPADDFCPLFGMSSAETGVYCDLAPETSTSCPESPSIKPRSVSLCVRASGLSKKRSQPQETNNAQIARRNQIEDDENETWWGYFVLGSQLENSWANNAASLWFDSSRGLMLSENVVLVPCSKFHDLKWYQVHLAIDWEQQMVAARVDGGPEKVSSFCSMEQLDAVRYIFLYNLSAPNHQVWWTNIHIEV